MYLLVVTDVCSCPDPARSATDRLLHRVHQYLHAYTQRSTWTHTHKEKGRKAMRLFNWNGISYRGDPDVVVPLTIVELTVWLLTVDDVEAVDSSNTHTAHLKIEPLVVVITVDIWVQHKVILISGETLTELSSTIKHSDATLFFFLYLISLTL